MLQIKKCWFLAITLFFACATSISYAEETHSSVCNNHNFADFFVKKINISVANSDVDHNLEFIYSPYLNTNINCDTINTLEKKITEYFIDQDYLRPKVQIVQKDKGSGILNFEVELASISDIIIVNSDLSTGLIEEYAKKILSLKPTKVKRTLRYLSLMGKVPGFKIDQELKRYNKTSELYLVITLSKAKGVINASADNYNIHGLGKIDQILSAEVYSPFGNNDLYSIQSGTTNHPGRFYNLMAGYSRPLNSSGTFINLIGTRTISNLTLHDAVPTKSSANLLASANLGHHLYLDGKQDLIGALNYSIRADKTYEVDTNNVAIPSLSAQYYSYGVGFMYTLKDSLEANNTIGISYNKGIGGRYDDYTGNSSPIDLDYNLISLNVSRDQPLLNDFSVFSTFSAAKISKDAPASVGLALGGRGYGRAYDAGTLIGNNMLAASFELRYNKSIQNSEAVKNINLYMFYDIGYIGPKDSTSNICNLSSAGPGIRMNLMYDIALSSEVAFPFKKNYVISDLQYKSTPKVTFLISKTFQY